jgi:hypothetical protein
MNAATRDEIKSKVLKDLEHTPFAASSLRMLSGGTANFIYHASLKTSLPDGTRDVLIKHGEAYIANSPSFKLTLFRCVRQQLLTNEL